MCIFPWWGRLEIALLFMGVSAAAQKFGFAGSVYVWVRQLLQPVGWGAVPGSTLWHCHCLSSCLPNPRLVSPGWIALKCKMCLPRSGSCDDLPLATDANCNRLSLSGPHKVTLVHVWGQSLGAGIIIWEGVVLQGCCVSDWLNLLSLREMTSP